MWRSTFAELAGETLREELRENGVVAIWGTIGGVRVKAQYDADNSGLYAVNIETLDAEQALEALANSRMAVADGWRFQAADFSIQAGGDDKACGYVRLVRCPEEKARWHKMREDMKDDVFGPPLYATGEALTFEAALGVANKMAASAAPIPKG